MKYIDNFEKLRLKNIVEGLSGKEIEQTFCLKGVGKKELYP